MHGYLDGSTELEGSACWASCQIWEERDGAAESRRSPSDEFLRQKQNAVVPGYECWEREKGREISSRLTVSVQTDCPRSIYSADKIILEV